MQSIHIIEQDGINYTITEIDFGCRGCWSLWFVKPIGLSECHNPRDPGVGLGSGS